MIGLVFWDRPEWKALAYLAETNPPELDVVLFDVDERDLGGVKEVLPGFEPFRQVPFVGHYRNGMPAQSYQGRPARAAIIDFATRSLF